MDAFAFSSLTFESFFNHLPTVFPSGSFATLVCVAIFGALLGSLVTYWLEALLCGVAVLVGWTVGCVQQLLALISSSLLLMKYRHRDGAVGLTSWKTYKKVMPWRNGNATRGGSMAETSTLSGRRSFSKSHPDWYGSEKDVDFFHQRVVDGDGTKWRSICENSLGDYFRYEAFFRVIPGNKTEYKSVSIVKDATAEEMTNFYLDDELRSRWDGMLAHTEMLEAGPARDRCQVVRWIRSFPFPFLSDREYIIGRRIFRKNGKIYTVTRGIEHAAAPERPSLIRMEVFYSMWCCTDIECPWGSGRPACEVVLLHHEQFKIPERLARFAACKGMWGFIKSMGPAVVSYIQTQRISGSGSSSASDYNTSSEISIASGDSARSTTATGSRCKKPNRLARTARRALVAALLTTAVMLHNRNRTPKKQN